MAEVKNIWIQYVASQQHPLPEGAETLMRLPFGGFTWLLSEEWSFTGQVPAVGDRPRFYRTNYAEGGDDMQSRPGDWRVESIELFHNPTSQQYQAIAVCTCCYAPLPQEQQDWHDVPRVTQTLAPSEPILEPA